MASSELPVVVYTPASQLHTPGNLLRSMWEDLRSSRELAWRLFVRDISAQYRQSILGVLWAFLPPLVTGLVFIFLRAKEIVNLGETDIPYPVYVLVGTTFWQVFTESVQAPLRSIVASKSFLTKIRFPREALLVSAFYTILFGLAIKSLILAGILLYFDVPLTWGLVALPAALVMLILLGMAFGLVLAPLGALYTDVESGLVFAFQAWFFLTPVVYPPPQSFPYSLLATYNPVSPLLIGARDLATRGAMASPEPFLLVSALALAVLFSAWVMYRLALPILIERMSA